MYALVLGVRFAIRVFDSRQQQSHVWVCLRQRAYDRQRPASTGLHRLAAPSFGAGSPKCVKCAPCRLDAMWFALGAETDSDLCSPGHSLAKVFFDAISVIWMLGQRPVYVVGRQVRARQVEPGNVCRVEQLNGASPHFLAPFPPNCPDANGVQVTGRLAWPSVWPKSCEVTSAALVTEPGALANDPPVVPPRPPGPARSGPIARRS